MIKARNFKYHRSITVMIVIATCILTLVLGYWFGHTSNANTEHNYHANMISKSFYTDGFTSNTKSELHSDHVQADHFVDHVGNLRDYEVHVSYNDDKNGYGYEVEHVTLIRRHETPWQRKILQIEQRNK